VRSNPQGKIGFLGNTRRTNVALTRAKHGLIVIANANTLSSDKKWKELISYFKETGTFFDSIQEAIASIEQI